MFSGRWGDHRKKQTVENSLKLDINEFMRDNQLTNRSEGRFNFGRSLVGTFKVTAPYTLRTKTEEIPLDALILLSYKVLGEEVTSPLYITSSPMNFGNKRYWVLCPSLRDGRACLNRGYKLYLPPDGKYFLCRDCYNLTYKSVQTRDKRVSEMVNNPQKLFSALTATTNKLTAKYFLALKAYMKLLEKQDI